VGSRALSVPRINIRVRSEHCHKIIVQGPKSDPIAEFDAALIVSALFPGAIEPWYVLFLIFHRA
jgi:hypothetical protein